MFENINWQTIAALCTIALAPFALLQGFKALTKDRIKVDLRVAFAALVNPNGLRPVLHFKVVNRSDFPVEVASFGLKLKNGNLFFMGVMPAAKVGAPIEKMQAVDFYIPTEELDLKALLKVKKGFVLLGTGKRISAEARVALHNLEGAYRNGLHKDFDSADKE